MSRQLRTFIQSIRNIIFTNSCIKLISESNNLINDNLVVDQKSLADCCRCIGFERDQPFVDTKKYNFENLTCFGKPPTVNCLKYLSVDIRCLYKNFVYKIAFFSN